MNNNYNRNYAIIIGEVIVNMCIDRSYELNTVKLMKLLYFMQKLHIQKYGEPMFTNPIITSSYGPYIPDVYEYFTYGRLGFYEKGRESICLLDSHRDVALEVLDLYGNMEIYQIINISKKDVVHNSIWQNGKGNYKEISFYAFTLTSEPVLIKKYEN